MDFDAWCEQIAQQMRRKGHDFDPTDCEHSAALLGLVLTEVVEAAQEWKRHHREHLDTVADEIADALIRLGHFTATIGARLAPDVRFNVESFNALGDGALELSAVVEQPVTEFWTGINVLLHPSLEISEAHDRWGAFVCNRMRTNNANDMFSSPMRRCFLEISAAGRRLGLDLDAAVARRTAHNESRSYRYNIATRGGNDQAQSE